MKCVKCELCPHNCEISENSYGFCGTRKCVNGRVSSESYGRVTSIALDPIEKKPLYHFYPGSKILSVGSYGCNMKCGFCQNFQISQFKAASEFVSPEKLAEISRDTPENLGVAFTYNEPILSYEYILDTAPLIHNNNQKVVLVSNGNINPEPLKKLLPHIDAWNIDVKSFNEDFYTTYGGNLGTVKETVAAAAQICHIEVTTLIIPGENDEEKEIENFINWLADISSEIPYHLSRFFPRYNMTDKPPTPPKTLYRLAEIAKKRLRNVYIGNV